MKKLLAIVFTSIMGFSPLAFSNEYLTGEEWKAQFCNKSFLGENHKSGRTFKIYVNKDCNNQTVQCLTGDKKGQTIGLQMTIYPSGDHCIMKKGKERCGKIKSIDDSVFKRFSIKSGKNTHTYKAFVDGKQF